MAKAAALVLGAYGTAAVVTGVLALTTGVGGGARDDLLEREHAFPSAASVLPRPEEVGPGWAWPWSDGSSTEAEWRGRFDHDPRVEYASLIAEMEAISDEDYHEAMAGLGALMGGLAGTDTSAGHFLTAGGEIPKAFSAAQAVTREQAIAGARLLRDGTLDWATNDYTRNGAAEEDALVPPSDSLALELTVSSDVLLETSAATLDVSGDALAQVVGLQTEMRRKMQEASEKEVKVVEERLAVLAERGELAGDEGKALLRDMERVATNEVQVRGYGVPGADGGHVLVTEVSHSRARTITIVGRLRRGNAVLEFSRSAEGPFVDGAEDHTRALLDDMVRRLAPFAE
jgi:hypothetical protein